METLNHIKQKIIVSGIITSEITTEVAILMYEDGVINQKKAEYAVQLNQALSNDLQCLAWSNLYIKIISDFLLQDFASPGEIDEQECQWLFENVFTKKTISGNEHRLLEYLKQHTSSFPTSLENLIN